MKNGTCRGKKLVSKNIHYKWYSEKERKNSLKKINKKLQSEKERRKNSLKKITINGKVKRTKNKAVSKKIN